MADILREYLIGLGYKIDEAGWRKFQSAVGRSLKTTTELGAEAAATGLAIAAMVERVARHYEELYYLSQRTDASVNTLRTYSLAAKQVGLSVEQMTAAQEQFSAAQRMNPGVAALVKQFSSATDKGEQLVDTVAGLKKQFGEAGYFAAARMAQVVGLDEPTFRMLWMNLDRFKAAQAEQKRLMAEAGIDGDKYGKDFVEFGRELNTFMERIAIAGQRIAHDFLPYVSATVRELNALLKAFNEFNKETEGKVGMAGAVATGALGVYLVKQVGMRLLGMGGAAAAAGGAAGGTTAATIGGAAAATAGAPITAAALAAGVILAQSTKPAQGGPDLYKLNPDTGQYEPTAALKKLMDENKGKTAAPEKNAAAAAPTGAPTTAAPPAGLNIGDVSGMNGELVERLRRMRSDMPADVGGFHVKSGYRSPEDQAREYANRFRNPYPVAKPGGSQHEKGEAADLKFDTQAGDQWFRAQMFKYGVTTPVAGDPVHFERTENRMAGGKHPFLGAALTGAPQPGADITLNQHTEIKVEAGPTATATAQAVLSGQDRVSSDTVRNMGAKLR